MEKNKMFPALCIVGFLSVSITAIGGELSASRKIRAAVTSLSGSMASSWVAHEAGIFRRYGLQVEVIAMPSGMQGTSALIAGQIDFVQLAGGTIAGAVVGGADVKIVATYVGTKRGGFAWAKRRNKPLRHLSSHGSALGNETFWSGARKRRFHCRDWCGGLDRQCAARRPRKSCGLWISSYDQGGPARKPGVIAYPNSRFSLCGERRCYPGEYYPR